MSHRYSGFFLASLLLALALAGCGPKGAREYNHGIEHFRQGLHREAVAALEKAVELNPEFAEAHHSLGVCLIQTEDFDRAVASLERARALFEEGKHVETEDGKSLAQKHALVHRHLGLIEEHRYQRALSSGGDMAIAHLRNARVHYERTQQLDASEAHSRQRIEQIDAFLARLER